MLCRMLSMLWGVLWVRTCSLCSYSGAVPARLATRTRTNTRTSITTTRRVVGRLCGVAGRRRQQELEVACTAGGRWGVQAGRLLSQQRV